MLRTFAEMERLLISILQHYDYTKEESRICTRELLDAEWRGKSSYGIELVPHVIKWHKNKKADPTIVRESPSHAFIEGGDCAGPIAAAFAMDTALNKINNNNGFILVGTRNKWPWLVAGYHLRQAAEKGYIALTWSAGVSILAPHGGTKPVFGTNPFSYAIPTVGAPVVFDSAMTKGAASIIRDSAKNGSPLPLNHALDANGEPTNDPSAARKGALLPFGEHHGSGLALMIELLGGAWVGAKTGVSHKGSRGFVIMLADPDLFGFGEGFPSLAQGLVEDMVNAGAHSGDVHIPGQTPVDFNAPRAFSEAALHQLEALLS